MYKLNEQHITEKYCVNKLKPAKNCKGKCHLTKTIVNNENENTRNPFSLLNFKWKDIEICLYRIVYASFINLSDDLTAKQFYFTFDTTIRDGFQFLQLKPPATSHYI